MLDLPSIGEGVSSIRIASKTDGVILVVEAERVKREVVMRIKSKLDKFGANIFGVVLNKRKYYIPKWLYS